MIYRIGQRVICINDANLVSYGRSLPVKNKIYTIAEIAIGEDWAWYQDDPYFYLTELDPDSAFWSQRFRPLVESSIKVFTDILAKLPARVPARIIIETIK